MLVQVMHVQGEGAMQSDEQGRLQMSNFICHVAGSVS